MTDRRTFLTGAAGAVGALGAGGLLASCTTTPTTTGASGTIGTSAAIDTSGASGPATGTTTAAPPAGNPTFTLAPVGDTSPDGYSVLAVDDSRIEAAVAALDGIAEDVMQRSGIPGMAIAVVRGAQVRYAKGFGVREVGRPETIDADTVFQLASVSKSIAATCVAKAVTDKVVTWTDPIVSHLPDVELSDPAVTAMVTVADCFAHRTGLPDAAGDDLEGLGFDRTQILERLRLFPLDLFRASYHYTNFGLTLGGTAVAAAAGLPWEDLCAKNVYEPLRMTATSSTHEGYLSRANRATIHFPVDGGFRPLYTRDADAQSPAGGVSSSVNDLTRWLSLQLADGQVDGVPLIDPDVLLEMHLPHITNAPATAPVERSRFYGYGVNVETTSSGHVRWGHSGAFYVGAGTCYGIVPAAGVAVVVLTNAAPLGVAEAVAFSFTDLVRTGVVERDWLDHYGPLFTQLFVNPSTVAGPAPADAAPPRPSAAYTGIYRNDYVGDVTVTDSGGTLTVTLGPKDLTAPLTPYDGDVFAWEPPGGNGDPVSAVTFGGEPGGPVTTMTLEFLQLGDLVRV
ncbi:serine hydrolase [Nakamurella deserti]|uniref:serine hydrolase n=1 Tax=Nakamurella deserti TaxID=2164074 RepID=UPI0013002E49|nr:serine hydrolase [Nakamurella deserti]